LRAFKTVLLSAVGSNLKWSSLSQCRHGRYGILRSQMPPRRARMCVTRVPGSEVHPVGCRRLAGVRFAVVLLALSGLTFADTLYLKSGISISISKAQESNGQVQYWIGDDVYTVSKDEVLKIEKGDPPATPGDAGTVIHGPNRIQDLTRRDAAATSPPHQ